MNREQQIIALALAQARRMRDQYGTPQIIGLSIYASDADLRQLRPEDGPDATAAQQRRITDAVAAALRGDGHLVKLVTLKAAEYLKWLTETGQINDASIRAKWINLQTTKS
jgi:hypothetical protein